MKKMYVGLAGIMLSFGLVACGGESATLQPGAEALAQSDQNLSGSTSAQKNAASEQSLSESYLKLMGFAECGLGDVMHYEVLQSGLMRYNREGQILSRQLSPAELSALKAKVAEVDLSSHATADQPVPENAPQTLECRMIDTLILNADAADAESFDRNGRQLIHTEGYRQAFDNLVTELERLVSEEPAAAPAASGSYALPLEVKVVPECGYPEYTRYSVSASGLLRWTVDEYPVLDDGEVPEQASRQLSAAEQQELLALLDQTQLVAQVATSEAVPADAPQTRECRSVMQYQLQVDGQLQSFEGEGSRKLRHSDALLEQLEQLRQKLEALSQN